ncbi:PREDICTED: acyl-CoA--sterol O-acyltransferase 1-like isoform X1 [Ipomoea nil]|uniref:acyl-CoA--sterol O-acyltransferase 1-like isoform X1 n=1 Tax=Ipomoea nil TaxID=35883 RepID=UPI0009008A2C|nr:PREDICTED: acyl-CoA--sterol O-acyltransferase 1-like isoform X1 [Ipomoea nil]
MEGDMKSVMKHWMEGEIAVFIKVWFSIYLSLSYCFFAAKMAPVGLPRLLLFLPVISLFLLLPLALHSVHLCGTTAFFISWLANFKLLMLAFNHGAAGPLSLPSLSLPRFLLLACLPIKIHQKHSQHSSNNTHSAQQDSHQYRQLSWFLNGRLLIKTQDHRAQKHETPILSPNKLLNHKVKTQDRVPTDTIQKHQTLMLSPNELLNHGEKPSVEISENRQKSGVSYAVKAVMMGLIIRIYDYSDRINPTVILIIYCLHIYLCLEIILAIVAALARAVLGLELEPQFNEPYLSASLQDFWGRRWNLMVNRILRPTVYNPVLGVSAKYLGRKWATFPAVMATFFVSGLMHELIFFYLGRARPTWEITWFFLLHGACVAVEVAVKKALRGRCRLPGMLGTILTVGFVMLTGFWLFFPQLLRCEADVKAFAEYAALGAFVKDVGRALTLGARSALGL